MRPRQTILLCVVQQVTRGHNKVAEPPGRLDLDGGICCSRLSVVAKAAFQRLSPGLGFHRMQEHGGDRQETSNSLPILL